MVKNIRLKFVFFGLVLFFIAISVRLFYWQIVRGKDLSNQARKQFQIGKTINAQRGNILASDGSFLAARVDGWLVYASLPEIKNVDETADQLAPILLDEDNLKDENGLVSYKEMLFEEAGRIKNLLTKDDLVWVALKKKINTQTKKEVENLDLPGIGFENEDLRYYPESSAAAHLLGFVGKDEDGNDQGYFGLEGYHDLELSGKPGYMTRDSDVKGAPIVLGSSKEAMAISGVDLLTHINKGIQLNLEKKLKDGIEKYGAKAGTAIIMNPKDGAVYAMSSYPSFDPSDYSSFENELFKNSAVSESFEPGSVFKIIVMAAGLDAKVVKTDTKCEICNGPFKVDKYFINTWDGKYYPDSTMTDVIVHSDNVGMVYVTQKLGVDTLYDYLDKFGLGSVTGIDLQGEFSPELRKKGNWNVVDTATAGFGQGIALTPIQLITAASVIANKGNLVTPQVVDKLRGDGWEEDIKPDIKKGIISQEAALDMTAMMVAAAEHGEAKWTYLRGFGVAGKTGTAQIPIAGHYDEKKTIASFIGFAPWDDPKFIMLVTLKEPTSSQWASETAAPLWYDIAKDLFIQFGIQPR